MNKITINLDDLEVDTLEAVGDVSEGMTGGVYGKFATEYPDETCAGATCFIYSGGGCCTFKYDQYCTDPDLGYTCFTQ